MFIYLHADVFLPDGWYDEMVRHQNEYDFFECYRKHTILFEYMGDTQNKAERAYSGSQMGKMEAFNKIKKIDDDYSYRQEDIIFKELVEENGLKYGRIPNTFHYHQTMNKIGEKEPKLERIIVEREKDEKWEKMTHNMQAKGIIKYLQPKKYLVDAVNSSILELNDLNALDWSKFKKWVKKTNPVWLNYIHKNGSWKQRMAILVKKICGKYR